jgi:UV DNA damage endonuclease
MIHRIGYACLNQTLSNKKFSVNRGMVRKTFLEKGTEYASELIAQNLEDLSKVITWNHRHHIRFYRLSSDMFPWMSEYEIEALPQFNKIHTQLKNIGRLAAEYDQRLTYHPGPFNVLASENEHVVNKTIKELNQHSQIMDLMELSQTPFNKINIHIGTTLQGEKQKALDNFCRNFERLSAGTQSRLTVENDDKGSMFHTGDLYAGIHKLIGIPLVFDFHHHYCHSGGISEEDAIRTATSTWPAGILPVVHYSEPKSFTEKKLIRAHADFIEHEIPDYGQDFDVMLEAKQKECALIRYRQKEEEGELQETLFNSLPTPFV